MADVKEIKEEDLEAAKAEAVDEYTVELSKPLKYNDEVYTKLEFNFEKLVGKDLLAIDAELRAMGIFAAVPAGNHEFIIRMASRACKQDIGADAFEYMGIKDLLKVIAKARGFLLASE